MACCVLLGSWLSAACGGKVDGLPEGWGPSGAVGTGAASSGDVETSGSAATGSGLAGSGTVAGAGSYAGSGTATSGAGSYSGTLVGSGAIATTGSAYSGSFASGTGSGVTAASGNPCNFPLPALCEFCGNGEVVCAHYAIRNGMCVTEICPPSIPPAPTGCMPGAMCSPGSGCGSAAPGPSGCFSSCTCDATGHLQCAFKCPPPPPPPVCAQGALCQPGNGCTSGGLPYPGGCTQVCTCDGMGRYQCSQTCLPPSDPCAGLPIPKDCQLCGDGSYRCAHYVDVAGKCVLETCPSPPPVPLGCAQGAACVPNTGCGVGSPYGCFESCWCDAAGQYECKNSCPIDAGPYPYFDAGATPDYDVWVGDSGIVYDAVFAE